MSGLLPVSMMLMLSATVSSLSWWAGIHNPWVTLCEFIVCYFISDVTYRIFS
ncbi:hypothetical protein [Enterobacillus tribolii]|uniref:Uncharacterized protein n=1 Tax=Enterobacillus tribolii TaxID=1487935 RepID=A0A370R2G6_9GAMM|nr:hypothetical protein [Enterobacillus tribolii]RDK96594.1 hypothetical protein C8D90_10122 [Enterobacillus tribolii]